MYATATSDDDVQLFIRTHVAASLSKAEPRTFSARTGLALEWTSAAIDDPLMAA